MCIRNFKLVGHLGYIQQQTLPTLYAVLFQMFQKLVAAKHDR